MGSSCWNTLRSQGDLPKHHRSHGAGRVISEAEMRERCLNVFHLVSLRRLFKSLSSFIVFKFNEGIVMWHLYNIRRRLREVKTLWMVRTSTQQHLNFMEVMCSRHGQHQLTLSCILVLLWKCNCDVPSFWKRATPNTSVWGLLRINLVWRAKILRAVEGC